MNIEKRKLLSLPPLSCSTTHICCLANQLSAHEDCFDEISRFGKSVGNTDLQPLGVHL